MFGEGSSFAHGVESSGRISFSAIPLPLIVSEDP